jgi:hypothetical protein
MKLAEALIVRSDLQKRIEQLRQRLVGNARAQEGEEPAENPEVLLLEFKRMADELESIIQQINRTNSGTAFRNGMTLSDALAVRDVLKLRLSTYTALADAAALRHDRYSRSEVKFIPMVSVTEIQRKIGELAKEHRLLDAAIQAANWSVDMVE